MSSQDAPYTLVRTVSHETPQFIALERLPDLATRFEAATASADQPTYIPVEVVVVLETFRDGSEPDIVRLGARETWVFNVATVLSLSPFDAV